MEQMSNKILIKSTNDTSKINQSNNTTPIDLVINEDNERMRKNKFYIIIL